MSNEQYITSPVCEYIQGLWPAKGWQAGGGGWSWIKLRPQKDGVIKSPQPQSWGARAGRAVCQKPSSRRRRAGVARRRPGIEPASGSAVFTLGLGSRFAWILKSWRLSSPDLLFPEITWKVSWQTLATPRVVSPRKLVTYRYDATWAQVPEMDKCSI